MNIRKNLFGMTQVEFAEACGVVQSSVHRWEKSGFIPPRFHDKVREIARHRNVRWQNVWLVEAPSGPEADDFPTVRRNDAEPVAS